MTLIEKIRNKTYALGTTDNDVVNYLQLDYNDLVDLINRLSNDNEIYEEDHSTLNHVLDYLEILMEILKDDNRRN